MTLIILLPIIYIYSYRNMEDPQSSKLNQITQGVDECNSIASDIGRRMGILKQQKDKFENDLKILRESHSELDRKSKESNDKIIALEGELKQARDSHGSATEEQQKIIKDLEKKLNDELENGKKLKEETTESKNKLDQMNSQNDILINKINDLKQNLSGINADLPSAQALEGGKRNRQHGGNKQMNVTHYKIKY